MSQFYNDSIFWIEVEKIHPNPYQPRKEFDQAHLQSLADSMRQYGVLQALVVTRTEVEKPDGGLAVEYELIAGERRLRAAKLAGLTQVPVLIRTGAENDLTKLELAIIENIQREDLNPVDRAKAFDRLAKEFGFKHAEIAKKVGKSREYVSNTMRLLMLPDHILQALAEGKITEGHTRPLMMLTDRKEEQETLFKEIVYKKLNVREAEGIARRIAFERARKLVDPELIDIEEKLKESLGTRVRIEKKEEGGKITIDFFSNEDLRTLFDILTAQKGNKDGDAMLKRYIATKEAEGLSVEKAEPLTVEEKLELDDEGDKVMEKPLDDDEEDLYSIKDFTV
ncbi:MAG: chromosome partitioning protein, ParB family [Parcubacteria bacterium C7867-005]|nr:MAG: chromosome partitioning protein, ParB family [Parcubacteria bacterium C7867-005]